jgi:hypothetical protein
MLTDKAVDTTRGKGLADEYGMQFFETSAKNNINVEEVPPSSHSRSVVAEWVETGFALMKF